MKALAAFEATTSIRRFEKQLLAKYYVPTCEREWRNPKTGKLLQ